MDEATEAALMAAGHKVEMAQAELERLRRWKSTHAFRLNERPILFSAPMVRALLAGTKTQTRRALAPDLFISSGGAVVRMKSAGPATTGIQEAHCPYGRQPGDRLWVREAFAIVPRTAYRCSQGVQQTLRPNDDHDAAIYREGWFRSTGGFRWRPSIHMPRWASRITLEVTGVRVEPLNSISRGDAMQEGCPFPNMAHGPDPIKWYADLWDRINGSGSWLTNPLVWVVEFKRCADSRPNER